MRRRCAGFTNVDASVVARSSPTPTPSVDAKRGIDEAFAKGLHKKPPPE